MRIHTSVGVRVAPATPAAAVAQGGVREKVNQEQSNEGEWNAQSGYKIQLDSSLRGSGDTLGMIEMGMGLGL